MPRGKPISEDIKLKGLLLYVPTHATKQKVSQDALRAPPGNAAALEAKIKLQCERGRVSMAAGEEQSVLD